MYHEYYSILVFYFEIYFVLDCDGRMYVRHMVNILYSSVVIIVCIGYVVVCTVMILT